MRGLTRNQLVLVLAIVVLLIVGVVFGVFYYQAVSYKAAVAKDIEQTEANIERMSWDNDVDRLSRELAPLQSQLAEAPIPITVDNVAVFDAIHLAAVKAKVEYDYGYDNKSLTIAGTRYTAMTIEIDTSGTTRQIIRFLDELEKLRESDYDTLRITDIELNLRASDTWSVEFNIEIIIQGA